jgi:hypothetical protein
MNITSGQSAKKQHLSNGSLTACNRRTSFSQHDFESFKWTAENWSSHCCQKCLNSFNEKQNRLNEKMSKLQNQLK